MKHQVVITESLRRSFTEATPFKHLVIPHFLASDDQKRLLTALGDQDFTRRVTDIYSFWQTDDFKITTNPILKEFRDHMRKDVVTTIAQITGLQLTSGVIDMHAAIYRDTDHLLCHDDQLEGRKVAYMLYLSSLAPGDGAALELYNSHDGEPTTVAKRIVPTLGTLLIFEVSALSFHAVSELIVPKDRITIAGWFHGTD